MKRKQIYLFILLSLMLVACGDSTNKDKALNASQSGNITRAHWQTQRKPVVIETDTLLTPVIGVSMLLSDATMDEVSALQSATFTQMGKSYHANDPHALTSDTAALTGICYPVRRGIKANSAIDLNAPFSENLYGKETGRQFGKETHIRMKWRSAMALLRIVMESDDVRDRLNSLSIQGDRIYNAGIYMPYTGEWCDKSADGAITAPHSDCRLNNGRNHDFFLIPTDSSGTVLIHAYINGAARAIKKVIPPLHAGSLLELHLRASNKNLVVSSSWVENHRKLYMQSQRNLVMDTVKTGHFLSDDGFLTTTRTNRSIAVVFETDGQHGKAVALENSEGRYVFSNNELPKGKEFATIDGKRREGILNPAPHDGVDDADKVIWTPKMPYDEKCAIGFTDGAALTHMLVVRTGRNIRSGLKNPSMLTEAERHPGAYIPSLGELVRLYYQVKQRKVELPDFTPLEGEYLTSSENGNHYYMMDFSTGIITSSLTKQYGAAQLRLFYQF